MFHKHAPQLQALGLLILRASIASMLLFGHGVSKVIAFSEKASTFPDPLGIGSPSSMALAIFGEAICTVGVIVGWKTRFAVIPPLITMAVAVLVVHAHDPWAKKEFALLYAIP